MLATCVSSACSFAWSVKETFSEAQVKNDEKQGATSATCFSSAKKIVSLFLCGYCSPLRALSSQQHKGLLWMCTRSSGGCDSANSQIPWTTAAWLIQRSFLLFLSQIWDSYLTKGQQCGTGKTIKTGNWPNYWPKLAGGVNFDTSMKLNLSFLYTSWSWE